MCLEDEALVNHEAEAFENHEAEADATQLRATFFRTYPVQFGEELIIGQEILSTAASCHLSVRKQHLLAPPQWTACMREEG